MIYKGQWWEFGQDTGVTPPTLYEKCHGIFNDHRESGPWFNVSSERLFDSIVSPSHTVALGPTQTTGWAPPAGLTNTSSNSNLVFPGGLPFRYWPGSRLGLGNQIAISTRGVIIWQGVENRHNTGPCSVLIWTCYFGCASCVINPDIKFHLVRFVNRINWLPHFLRTGSKERFVQVPNFTKWPAFLRNKMKTKLNATERNTFQWKRESSLKVIKQSSTWDRKNAISE